MSGKKAAASGTPLIDRGRKDVPTVAESAAATQLNHMLYDGRKFAESAAVTALRASAIRLPKPIKRRVENKIMLPCTLYVRRGLRH